MRGSARLAVRDVIVSPMRGFARHAAGRRCRGLGINRGQRHGQAMGFGGAHAVSLAPMALTYERDEASSSMRDSAVVSPNR